MFPQFTANAWLRFDAIRHGIAVVHPSSVLEMGPGLGAFAAWIAPKVDYVGVELDDRSRARAQARLASVNRGRIVGGPNEVGSATFAMVCAFEVLEHIEDDVEALASWRAHLESRGYILLSVPAHSDRFGAHDEMVGHFRRYDRDELIVKLDKAGFAAERFTSYGVGLGQALEWARNQSARRREIAPTIDQRTAASARVIQPKSKFDVAARAALAAPFRVLQAPFASSDYGVGYVVLARSTS